ncbi:uncharacterized protein FIBRA_04008 [Fibroporia radiculosa]|uniref:Amino acid permease/ SLC12A domain-containing protein n=1 Tax=Fibroporia radiculosa TaxID=599839 RepID=J4GNV5_9APHY|nr:uncharacterized protein FIBRA_04008 [Fibroporia radiculosa]CCM01935.1 predicted protein [Fibroporia radiculosa]
MSVSATVQVAQLAYSVTASRTTSTQHQPPFRGQFPIASYVLSLMPSISLPGTGRATASGICPPSAPAPPPALLNKFQSKEKSSDDGAVVKELDSESLTSSDGAETRLKRQLKNRHIAMISYVLFSLPIAHSSHLPSLASAVTSPPCVIGTGLFLNTANSLADGGPVGLLLGYVVVGTICYSVMISLGEMVAYLPVPGGHIKLAERFVDPAFSFTMGWNYWYNWTIVLPAELSAAAVLINYWNQTINNAVWITIFLVVVITINFFGAGAYGEAEFIFSSVKVITITGLIILGIVLDLGGGPNHDRIGFRYWKHPGPFVQYNDIGGVTGRFLGWWSVMTNAAFSYIGTEIVAIAAGEAKNPRRNLPKAIRRVYIRILLFYIGGVTVIGLLVPSNNPFLNLEKSTAAKSPFVIAINTAGIKGLPSVINAALLTAAASAASSDLYTSSRALYGLALVGNAPKIFTRTSRNGVPFVSLIFCAAFSTLAYMGVTSGSGKVFNWFANMTSVAGLMTWFGICVTYLRFYDGLKAQGYDRTKLPYWTRLQPFAAWYGACFCFIVCLLSGWAVFLKGNWVTATFVTNYLPFVLFPILYIGAKIWIRVPLVAPQDMDFVSGLKEIEAATYDEPPPRNWLEAFWGWLPPRFMAPRIQFESGLHTDDATADRSDSPTLGFWGGTQAAAESDNDRDSFDAHPMLSPYASSKPNMRDQSRVAVLSSLVSSHDDWSSEIDPPSPGVIPSSAYIVDSPSSAMPSSSAPLPRLQNHPERSAPDNDSFLSETGLSQSSARSPSLPAALPDPSQFPDPYPYRPPRWQHGAATPALSSADSSSASTRSSAYTSSARSGDYGHVHVVSGDPEQLLGSGLTTDDVVQLLARDSSSSSAMQGRSPYEQGRWSDLYANSIRSRSSSVGNSRPDPAAQETSFRTLRTTPSFDMAWQPVDERDEAELASEDEITDDDDCLDDEEPIDDEEQPTSAMVIAEEGRGVIVRGDDAPIVRLQVKPGTTHLLIGSSTTPNAVPAFLTGALPQIASSLLALDISANFLGALPPVLAACLNLEELNIASNPLRALPEFLSRLTSLRVLIVDSTGINTLSESLSSADKLHTLSIRRNKFNFLPSWLWSLEGSDGAAAVEDTNVAPLSAFHTYVSLAIRQCY